MKNPRLRIHEPIIPKLSTLSLYTCFVSENELYIVVDKSPAPSVRARAANAVKVQCLTTPTERWMSGLLPVQPVRIDHVEVTPILTRGEPV